VRRGIQAFFPREEAKERGPMVSKQRRQVSEGNPHNVKGSQRTFPKRDVAGGEGGGKEERERGRWVLAS